MKFRNPETGELFEDISDALESAYQCWDCPGIGGCPMGRKAMSYNMDCCSVAEKHAEKAARLMGYEVVEDDEPRTCFNCIGCEIEKDFDPQEGCKNWVKRKEANMDKPRICQVLGVEVGEEFTYDFGANQVNRGAFKIGADGKRYYKTGDLWNPCYNEDDLAVIINHPDRIIRKPRWTQQEVELAKAAKKLFPEASDLARMNACALALSNDHGGHIANINSDLFPSLPLGLCVKLDEIIGGAK